MPPSQVPEAELGLKQPLSNLILAQLPLRTRDYAGPQFFQRGSQAKCSPKPRVQVTTKSYSTKLCPGATHLPENLNTRLSKELLPELGTDCDLDGGGSL